MTQWIGGRPKVVIGERHMRLTDFRTWREAALGGALVLAGKAGARVIGERVPLPFIPPRYRAALIAAGLSAVRQLPAPVRWGAWAAPIESLVIGLKLPVIADALSSYSDLAMLPADGGDGSTLPQDGSAFKMLAAVPSATGLPAFDVEHASPSAVRADEEMFQGI
jgi:hypothetical protein